MKINDNSKTKIIATLGPAVATEEKLRELIYNGIDVCRLNFSHGSHEDHDTMIKIIRKLNRELNTHIAIIADLQGPKIRLGVLEEEGITVSEGDEITITNIECKGSRKQLYISYQDLPADVRVGDAILIDDGKIKLEVIASDSKSEILTRTVHGGKLYSKKGVNLPDTRITIPSLTEKDINDVEFILDHDIEWIALSFVRWASDILALKKIIRERKKGSLVIAKIEKPEALKEIDSIIDEADAIMVARGDLGVEVSFDKVPYIQKQIVQKCLNKSTPVVIATQMLESMISSFRPTRAEANDVANAVFDCADTVMLSGETSVGAYPVEAIQSMQRIIDSVEGTEFVRNHEHIPIKESVTYIPDSVCFNACRMADQSGAKAIVAFAVRHLTGFRLASNRPKAPIYIFTPDHQIIHQLSIVWGVKAFYIEADRPVDDALNYSVKTLKELKYIVNGDIVVHVSSLPLYDFRGVNAIRLSYV